MPASSLSYLGSILPDFLRASLLTLLLGAAGVCSSLALGLIVAVLRQQGGRLLSGLLRAYIEVARNTPLLAQLFFLYFGLPALGLRLSGTLCAFLGLSFLGTAYMAEAFRAGLEAIPKAQLEAARSLGLSPQHRFLRIQLPQVLHLSFPALSANTLFLMKETSIVGLIAVPDLMHLTQDLIGMYYRTNETLLLLTLCYLLLFVPLSLGLGSLEKQLAHAHVAT